MNLTTKVRITCFSVMICLCVLMIAAMVNNILYNYRSIPIDTNTVKEIEKYEQRFKEKIEKIRMNQPNYDEDFYAIVARRLNFIEKYSSSVDKKLFERDSILIVQLRNKYPSFSGLNVNEFLFDNSDSVIPVIKNAEMKLNAGEELTEREEKAYEKAKKNMYYIQKNFVDYTLLGYAFEADVNSSMEVDKITEDGYYRDLFLSCSDTNEGIIEGSIIDRYHFFDIYLDFVLGVAK